MLRAALYIIAKRQKQPKRSPTVAWKNKMWYIHAMGYYLAIKSNKALIHTLTWMNLQNVIPSERRQSQVTTYMYDPMCIECLEQANPQ